MLSAAHHRHAQHFQLLLLPHVCRQGRPPAAACAGMHAGAFTHPWEAALALNGH